MEKYLSLFEKVIDKEVRILSIDDLKKEFPDHYEDNNFLEVVGRKLFFEDFEDEAMVFLMSISDEDIIGYDLYILATINFNKNNYLDAELLFKKALDAGYTRSYYWLGYMAETGLVKSKDENKAREYYKHGSECGYLMASRSYLRINLKLESGQEHYSNIPIYSRFIYKAKLLFLSIKSFTIALRDVSDERLADIPKAG